MSRRRHRHLYTIPPYEKLASGNGGFWSGHRAKLAK
jgi:hypothetical protein